MLAAKKFGGNEQPVLSEEHTDRQKNILKRVKNLLDDFGKPTIPKLVGLWNNQQEELNFADYLKIYTICFYYYDVIEPEREEAHREELNNILAPELVREFADNTMTETIMQAMGQSVIDIAADFPVTENAWVTVEDLKREWSTQRADDFYLYVTEPNYDNVKNITEFGIKNGYSPNSILDIVKNVIGLNKIQCERYKKYFNGVLEELKQTNPNTNINDLIKRAAKITRRYANKLRIERAKSIIRSELVLANSKIQEEYIKLLQKFGLAEQVVKRWVTSELDNVCALCRGLNGVTVKVGEDFPDTIDVIGKNGVIIAHTLKNFFGEHRFYPPVHPNCCCGIEYIEVAAGPQNRFVQQPVV